MEGTYSLSRLEAAGGDERYMMVYKLVSKYV